MCLWTLCALVVAQRSELAVTKKACARMPVTEAAAEGPEVVVLDRRTKEPVADADLLVIASPTDRKAREALQKRQQELMKEMQKAKLPMEEAQIRLTAETGKHYRTGADGKVRVAAGKDERVMVIAIAGERFGRGEPGKPILIEAQRVVPVRVVDARGRPVRGVKVSIGAADDRWLHDGAGTTDKDGTCRIPIRPHSRDKKMIAAVNALTSERIGAAFDGLEPPTEPVQIQLPELGKVRVILYGPDERPLSLVQQVSLQFDQSKTSDFSNRRAMWNGSPNKLEPDGAMFELVELGRPLVARVRLKGSTQDIEFKGKGPTRRGELVILEGRTNVGAPVVAIRVLDPEGQPVQEQKLQVLYRFDGQNGQSGSASYNFTTTDENGRMRLTFKKGVKGVYVFRRSDTEITEYRGTAYLPTGNWKPGLQEGGDLQLKLAPVAGRGRLVDADGKPVAGVKLTASISQLHGSRGGSASQRWSAYEHRVKTDAEGRFEIREIEPIQDELQLSMTHEELVPGDGNITLPLDGKEHVVRLFRAGRIEATFEKGLGDLRPSTTLTNSDTDTVYSCLWRDGMLRSTSLPPGSYTLKLGDRRRDHVIDKIEVAAGSTADDARLKQIAWKQWFCAVHVKVVDEQGAPVKKALIWTYLHRKNGRSGNGSYTDENGEADLLAERADCTLSVVVEGYATVADIEPKAEVLVKLEKVPSVDLIVRGMPKAPDCVQLRWNASPKAEKAKWGDHHKMGELQDGKAILHPTKAGAWTVSLQFNQTYMEDRDLRRQIGNELRVTLPEIEFDTAKLTGKPIELKLSEDLAADLEQRFATIREILAKKSEDGGR